MCKVSTDLFFLQRVWLSRSFLRGCVSIRFKLEQALTTNIPGDTVLHSWEILGKLLQSEETKGILCDIGM